MRPGIRVCVAALTLAVAASGEGTAFADAPAPATTVDAKAIPEVPKPAPPKVEAPKADQPKVEQAKLETPKAAQTKVEQPKPVQPKAEKPKATQPKVEPPKVEKAKAEKPKPATAMPEKPKPAAAKPAQPKAVKPKHDAKVDAPSATPNELGSQRGAAAMTVSPPQATPSAGAASATRGAGTPPAAKRGRKASRPLAAAGVTPQRSGAGAAMSGHDGGDVGFATTPPANAVHGSKRVPTSPPHLTSHGVAAAARSPGRRLLPVPRLEAKPRSDATLVLAILFGAGVGLLFGRRVRRPLGPG